MPNERQTNEAHASAPEPASDRPLRPRRILLVDDDEVLARLVEPMLSHLGYTVVAITSSPEAFATFQAAPQDFDLLLTDHMMPGLTGIELAVACRQLRPDLPIILCTGASPALYAAQVAAQGIDAVLRKPFHLEELGCTIEQVLAHRT